MALYPCAIPNCIFDALIHENSCWACRQRFCFQHLKHPLHECSIGKGKGASDVKHDPGEEYEPEVSQLLSLLDQDLIKEEAESLRPGHEVSTIHLGRDWKEFSGEYIEGSSNYHVKIDFQDGISWLMRIRRRSIRNYTDQPLKLNMISEVATVQALYNAGVLVPQAFAKPLNSKLHPKLIYCYQTLISGEGWKPFYDPQERLNPLSDPSIHYIRSLAKWFIKMEQVRFNKVGSLTFSKDQSYSIEVGPVIGRYPYSSTYPYYSGPFHTSKEMWLASINRRLQLLAERRYCNAEDEIWIYLCLLEAKEVVMACEEMEEKAPFYIKHDDDQGDHIRSEVDGEITGIIDWEWAYTINKAEAFTSPTGFVPAEYHYGQNDTFSRLEIALMESYISLDRQDLAQYVNDGRKYHRLIDLLRWMLYTPEQLDGLRRAFLNLPDQAKQSQTKEECIDALMEKYKNDVGLKFLLDNVITPSTAAVKESHPKKKRKKVKVDIVKDSQAAVSNLGDEKQPESDVNV